MKYNIAILLSFIIAFFSVSCIDELDYQNHIIGDGNAEISATATFQPLLGNLDRSRAPGDAIKKIRNITVAVYQKKGETISLYGLYPESSLIGLNKNLTNEDMPTDYDKTNGEHQAESSTSRATFSLPSLPYGKYQIYVVANADVTEEQARTPESLKAVTETWNSDVAKNDQMFGYFTNDNDNDRTSSGFDAPTLIVNEPNMKIHAWMKRLASKVTIVYDGSGLYESIFIYIHKATIKDIPIHCALGEVNEPGKGQSDAPRSEFLIENGESFIYNKAGQLETTDKFPDNSQYLNWMEIDKSTPKRGAVDAEGKTHGENESALYFYENCQGDYADSPDKDRYDKSPKWDDVHTDQSEGNEGYKDNVKYGTYIEVEGYYVSTNPANQSSGPIKYRFMLGKNTTYNYNAERNHHYKLTLKFRGYANQPEWHIEYEENNPEVFPPEYFFVPYLYNRKVSFPLRVVGNCTSLKAQIVENNWAPYDSTAKGPYNVPAAEIKTNDPRLPFRWNKEVFDNNRSGINFYYGLHDGSTYDVFSEADRKEIYKNGRQVTPIWAGFLALMAPSNYVNVEKTTDLPTNIMNDNPNSKYLDENHNWYTNWFSRNGLRLYFIGQGGNINDKNSIPQHERVMKDQWQGDKMVAGNYGEGLNTYTVTKNADDSHTFYIPMFTRPKAMIYISGFTGNNPYEAFQRRAVVRFTAEFSTPTGKKTIIKEVPVYQVRRLVNPKGVWRSWEDNSSFHVVLQRQNSPADINYSPFESTGPWKAYISSKTNSGKFDLTTTSANATAVGDTIFGQTGSFIDFSINFKGINKGDSECCVVEIDYHGYTCQHTIMVRHGYFSPMAVDNSANAAKWSSFTVYKYNNGTYGQTSGELEAELTKNPLSMGSMFKRGNYAQGIRIINNRTYGPLAPIGSNNLELTNSAPANWAGIKGNITKNGTFSFLDFKSTVGDEVRHYRVPTYQDFQNLLSMDFGYGVMYTDGAIEAARKTTDFSFLDYENNTTKTSMGMRGVFVYNTRNAHQVFFPVGAYGIGRRTTQKTDANTRGYLRYGAVAEVLSYDNGAHNQYRPITYNLPVSPGAVYWLKTNNENYVAWDMNYYDMSFNAYDYAVTLPSGEQGGDGNGDAIIIKPVYVRTGN